MSEFELKPNTGFIFKNEKKADTHPDYKGRIDVDGVEKEIALWVKEGKKGKFFSVKISEKYVKPEQPEQPESLNPPDESLPF